MISGDESPWFPGFPVYRQGTDGDWSEAMGKLKNDLRVEAQRALSEPRQTLAVSIRAAGSAGRGSDPT